MAVTGYDDRNVLGLFFQNYEATFAGSWASMLGFYNGNSDRAAETYGFFGSNPAMREWIGARQAVVLNKKSLTITNKPYEATIAIPQEELDRDKTGILNARLSTFASDAGADHWETLLTSLINSNPLCYDTQNFFDTDHAEGDSGTQVNELGVTQVPSSNVTTTTAPTPTEMANCILEATAHMLTYVNDKARPVNGQARKFVVQVSTAPLFAAATQAISSNLLAGTVDNPLTGMKQGGFTYSVSLVPGITSATDKFNLFRADGPLAAFILQDEKPIEVNLLGRGSDFYFENNAIKLGVDARRAVGPGLWHYASRITLT